MPLKVKSVTASANKLVSRARGATGDYKDGINSTNDQAERAIAGEEAYVAGVTDAISRGARVKGLEKAGTGKWKERALNLGAGRYASGVQAGKGDYEKNVAPFFKVLESITLSPRGPKGSPENYDRSKAVGEALRAEKIEQEG